MDGVSPDESGARTADSPPGESAPPEETDQQDDQDPTFEIPDRPERRYTRSGGVEYRGGVAFHLVPDADLAADDLDALLGDVFEGDRYVRGDWFDFPRPVYLVHDRDVSTSFRVVVRTDRLELHAIPSTAPAGLRTLYERLSTASGCEWSVRREIDPGV